MRARRSDYTPLNRPPDVPYVPVDSRSSGKVKFLDRSLLVPLEDRSEASFANTPGASFRQIERGSIGTVGKIPPSYRSTRSGLERSHDGAENVYGVSDRVFSSIEGNSSAACEQFAFAREQFSLAGTTERNQVVPSDRTPQVCAASERPVAQSLDQSFFKVGLWNSTERNLVSEAGSVSGGAIGPQGSSQIRGQSSGGSFTESLVSSDFPPSTISPSLSLNTIESTLLGTELTRQYDSCSQSWAQQTEQTYNLQLALALRLVATTELTEEPLLSASGNENVRSSATSAALRFWVNGSLCYSDKIQDGFYHIWGLNPHIWAICNDTKKYGWLPSLDLLRQVDPSDASMEVVLFDKNGDSHLRDLENQAKGLALKSVSLYELAKSLGGLVCSLMGGAALLEDRELVSQWRTASSSLKNCVSSLVIPVGSLSVGLCRHRALLYKALADSVDLPCRITRGCKYCGLSNGASCVVLCGAEREWLVDLIANPGDLNNADSFLKNLQLPPINSPLRLPDLKASEMASGQLNRVEGLFGLQVPLVSQVGLRGKQNMLDKLGENVSCNGRVNAQLGSASSPLEGECKSSSLTVVRHGHNLGEEKQNNLSLHLKALGTQAAFNRVSQHDKTALVTESRPSSQILPQQNVPDMKETLHEEFSRVDTVVEPGKDVQGQGKKGQNLSLSLTSDGLEIPWEDLILKERIGAGSFGTVHRADWHGSDVAVKILIEQDIQDEHLQEFLREVALMKRMRHPNVVLLMGAITRWPNFSIVTEYLPRGSLFRLLRRANAREMLDEKRRIRMAIDVAKGMNYLHRMTPPVVHRDLKSPNLLVDKTWTVKVCDFGLSRFKGNTFLSSRSAVGTPEWMAPEVLRDEPSNEKCDVYSFGIILWELVTLQPPWNGLSPAQVVGAVGFQNRRLQIPKDINPDIATLIEACFSDDSKKRPSFASIMDSLKNVQKLTMTENMVPNVLSPC